MKTNEARETLLRRIEIPWERVNAFHNATDIEAECARYTQLLTDYPVDIVCLGIGENGHIAFKDPGVADFNDNKLIKVACLDEVCRNQQVNDGCFATIEEVPTRALTLTGYLLRRFYLVTITAVI